MKYTVTIDVEEEGLFGGVYSTGEASANNVYELDRLDPLFLEQGIRPTLLVSYQVATKKNIMEKVHNLKNRWNAEVGAHLHHWNTPPIVIDTIPAPAPSELMSSDLLEAKTQSLLNILSYSDMVAPSFRMGRFNLGPQMFQVLEKVGIKVDSSVTPLRKAYGGPDHLCAPTDPYFPDSLAPTHVGNSSVLEVPITILPLVKGVDRWFEFLSNSSFFPGGAAEWLAMNLASIAAQPAWVSLNIAKTAVRLHKMRGGDCVTIFFHSSELAPGLNPLNPAEEDVQRFIKKLGEFIRWLRGSFHAKCYTLSELYPIYEPQRSAPTDIVS